MPPTRKSDCRDSSEIHVAMQRLQHREVRREAARQLAGAPLGEEARREAHEVREHVLAQLRDHALRRAREQVDLDEVHQPLQRERSRQAERDAVEQRAVVLLERGVEQVLHDGGKGEPHRRGDERGRPRRRRAARDTGGRAAAGP